MSDSVSSGTALRKDGFTPGPWAFSASVHNNRGWDAESQTVQIWTADHETLIATYKTDYAEYPETYACNEANARLIAAAPDLFEALRFITEQPDSVQAWADARAAIRKATEAQ